jgi:WD40 repeat protein
MTEEQTSGTKEIRGRPSEHSVQNEQGEQSLTLTHGISLQAKILPSPSRCIVSRATMPPDKLWVLDSQVCRLWSGGPLNLRDDVARKLSPVVTKGNIVSLFPAGVAISFVDMVELGIMLAWSTAHNTVFILDTSMTLLSSTVMPHALLTMHYNRHSGEVLCSLANSTIGLYFLDRERGIFQRSVLHPARPGRERDTLFRVIALDDNDTQRQLVFAGCGQSICICEAGGKQVAAIELAHNGSISALLYHAASETLISGSADGIIKLWDPLWQLLHVFVGHTGAVTSIVVFPVFSSFMTASLDGTVRVWSGATSDLSYKLVVGEPVLAISYTHPGMESFFTVTASNIAFWRISQLYKPFAVIDQIVSRKLYCFILLLLFLACNRCGFNSC